MTAPSELEREVRRIIADALSSEPYMTVDGRTRLDDAVTSILDLPALSGCGVELDGDIPFDRIAAVAKELFMVEHQKAEWSLGRARILWFIRAETAIRAYLSLLPGLSGGISSSSVDESATQEALRPDSQHSAGGEG